MAQVYEEILKVSLDSGQAERGLKTLETTASDATKAMRSLTAKTWSVTVSVVDRATAALKSIGSIAGQLAGKAIQIPVSIAGGAMRGLGAIGGAVGNIAATGVAAGAAGFAAFGLSAFKAAARVGELDSVLHALAQTNNVSYESLAKTANAVRGQGIEMASAQQLTAQFVQSNLDLSKATDLARVAQDAAVIGQMNSTDALDALVHGITTQQTDVLRQVGIQVDANQAQEDYAKALGISAKNLTAAQKSQAMMNAVLKAGERIAGSYAAAMEQPGKVLRSLPRLFNDIAVSAGTGLLNAFGPLIIAFYNLVKAFDLATQQGGALEGLFTALGAAAAKLAGPITPLIDRTTAWIKALDSDAVTRFLDTLKKFAPIVGPIVAFLGVKGGLNIAEMLGPLGFLIPKLNPVVAAVSTLLFLFPPLRNAIASLAQTLLSKLGPALDLVKAVVVAFTTDAGAMGVVYDKVREIFGDSVADALQPFLQTIMELIPRIPELTAAAQQLVGQGLGQVLKVAQTLAPIIGTTLEQAFSKLLETVRVVGPVLGQTFGAELQSLLQTVQTIAPMIGAFLGRAFTALLDVIQQLAPILGPIVAQGFATIMRVITVLVPVILQLAEAIGGFLITAVQTLWPIIQPLVPVFFKLVDVAGKLAQVIGTILGWVIGDLTRLLVELAPTFERLAPLVQGLADVVMWLADRLMEAMDAIIGTRQEGEQVDWVSQLADLINGLSGTIETFVGWLSHAGEAFSALGTAARTACDAIGAAFSALGATLQGIYDSTLKPILDKISGMLSAVQTAASGIGSAVSGAVAAANAANAPPFAATPLPAPAPAFDSGGWLPPGLSLVANNTGAPEPVLTPAQYASLGGGRSVNVSLGGLTINAPGGDARSIAAAMPQLAEDLLRTITPRIEAALGNMT